MFARAGYNQSEGRTIIPKQNRHYRPRRPESRDVHLKHEVIGFVLESLPMPGVQQQRLLKEPRDINHRCIPCNAYMEEESTMA